MLGAVAAQPDAADAPPSAELLLYLGEFEDAGGEFVDPMDLDATGPLPASDELPATPRPVEDEADKEDDDEPAPHSA